MIMNDEVKFYEGENSLRKKKTFLNKQPKHAWLKKSGYGSYRLFPVDVVVFFRQNSLDLSLKIRKDAKFDCDWLKTNEDLASKSHGISNFTEFSGSCCMHTDYLTNDPFIQEI